MINGVPIAGNGFGTYRVPPYAYWNGVLDLVSDETDPKYPLGIPEAKAFARITTAAEDGVIAGLIVAAGQVIEKYLNINIYNREVTVIINNPLGGQFLPYGPVSTATADIVLKDEYGTVITDAKWSGTTWPQLLWPQLERITATYNCGYDTDECPAQIVTALKEEFVFLYRNRGEEEQRSRDGGVVTLGISSVAKTLLRSLKRQW